MREGAPQQGGRRLELPNAQNTLVVHSKMVYERTKGRAPTDLAKLLNSAAEEAEEKGKRFIQIVFKNGTRIWRFYSRTIPSRGKFKYHFYTPGHVTDDFRDD